MGSGTPWLSVEPGLGLRKRHLPFFPHMNRHLKMGAAQHLGAIHRKNAGLDAEFQEGVLQLLNQGLFHLSFSVDHLADQATAQFADALANNVTGVGDLDNQQGPNAEVITLSADPVLAQGIQQNGCSSSSRSRSWPGGNRRAMGSRVAPPPICT